MMRKIKHALNQQFDNTIKIPDTRYIENGTNVGVLEHASNQGGHFVIKITRVKIIGSILAL